jgi:hypothetical protein
MSPIATTAALAGVAFVAGLIDAIAGGGGLVTVPALLFAVGDLRLTLGTNKGGSVFGALSALVAYARAGRIDRARALPSFIAAFLGSLAGVRLVLRADPTKLRPVILVLLVGVATFFAVRGARAKKAASAAPSEGLAIAREHPIPTALAIGLVLGMYDGFFGPGTGAFLIALYVAVFGDDLTRATANAKVANFASNLGSVITFAISGSILFRYAVPMGAAQILGGAVGARLAIKGGDRVVRAGVLVVTLALVARLGWQMLG